MPKTNTEIKKYRQSAMTQELIKTAAAEHEREHQHADRPVEA